MYFVNYCESLKTETPTLKIGHIFKLEKCEKTGTLQYSKEDEGFNLPNGLGFNSSYTKLFYCDLDARLINVYDFDLENGKPSKDFFLQICIHTNSYIEKQNN